MDPPAPIDIVLEHLSWFRDREPDLGPRQIAERHGVNGVRTWAELVRVLIALYLSLPEDIRRAPGWEARRTPDRNKHSVK
jgi:hypothetical protein